MLSGFVGCNMLTVAFMGLQAGDLFVPTPWMILQVIEKINVNESKQNGKFFSMSMVKKSWKRLLV